MVRYLLLLVVLPFLLIGCTRATTTGEMKSAAGEIRAVTFNIRYDNPNDGVHAWSNRRERVAELLREFDADIIALQEAMKHQLDFLQRELPDWTFIGVGRTDGRDAGEFSPIGFRTERFELVEWGTWWLSPTPDQPSRGWDAALPRIATWARLRDLHAGVSFLVVGTHFDHRGEIARDESAKLIASKLADEPRVLLMGDFNAVPESPPHRAFVPDMTDAAGDDQRATWCGWDGEPDPGRRIDWILARGLVRTAYEVPAWSRPDRPESDHLPVIAEFIIASP